MVNYIKITPELEKKVKETLNKLKKQDANKSKTVKKRD